MIQSKRWTLATDFNGKPRESDFKLVEEPISNQLNDSEVLCETLYLTVDPYMRAFQGSTTSEDIDKLITKLGQTMVGEQIARVIQSKNPAYPVGQIVRLYSGWRTHTLVKEPSKEFSRMPDIGDLPLSLALGVMGMPGMTAYFGFLEVCQPKEGETVVVSVAAGAVGSLVGQIAKIKGCKVIGFAGTETKLKWLKDNLGFDHVFNYKTIDADTALKQAAPEGVDCYFDNVGGKFTTEVVPHMNKFGRIAICGCISHYNDTEPAQGPLQYMKMLEKQLRIQGFIVFSFMDHWIAAEQQMKRWIAEGKIKYRETLTEGFENMPKAFMGLFEGSNIGKAIVKV